MHICIVQCFDLNFRSMRYIKIEIIIINCIDYYYSCAAETMGEAGLQLFLDAGCIVDNDVVNSLIKEVLLEKITSMTGESTTRDRPPTRDGASDDRLTASYDQSVSQVMIGACNLEC